MTFRTLCLAAVAASALSTAAWSNQAAQGAAQAPPTRAAMIESVNARFADLDANKDGSVVAAEIATAQTRALQQATAMQRQRIESEFAQLDTNKDKQLSLAEFKAAVPAPRASDTPAQIVAEIDGNKDGKLTVAEYRTPALATFDRVDSNKDGTLSEQETQALRQR